MIRTAARCVGLLVLAAVNYAQVLHAPVLAHAIPQATLMTAGDGGVFLPYGQGIAAYLASKGIDIAVRKSAGSNENLSAVDAPATTIGTAVIGSA
jgi:TRAP-type uncharacterized transport system substrate-binding protein